MKKSLWIVPLCLALLLTACGRQKAAPVQNTAPQEAAPAAAEQAPTEQMDQQMQESALDDLLDHIRENVTVGAAGSSLRAVAAAAELLDWAAGCSLDAQELLAVYEHWLPDMRSDLPVSFAEQLSMVDYSIRLLTDSDSAQAEALLADAGCSDCGYPWDEHAVAVTEVLMEAVGLR